MSSSAPRRKSSKSASPTARPWTTSRRKRSPWSRMPAGVSCGRTWDLVGHPVKWEMVPYDVQLIGGMVLHEGRIAEMATGEGKTLVAVAPLYLNALEGKGAHLVTVNDYLALRDSQWMGEVFRFLGLTVGVIQHGQTPAQRRGRVPRGRHLRDQQRVRLRLSPRQHGGSRGRPRAARAPLRDRGRSGFRAHRRGAHSAHHLRSRRRATCIASTN